MVKHRHAPFSHIRLKINVKSLAAESKTIRQEMRKLPRDGVAFASLHSHRTVILRASSRVAQLAYAAIRGVPYHVVERSCRLPPHWPAIREKAFRFVRTKDNREAVESWIQAAQMHWSLQCRERETAMRQEATRRQEATAAEGSAAA